MRPGEGGCRVWWLGGRTPLISSVLGLSFFFFVFLVLKKPSVAQGACLSHCSGSHGVRLSEWN